jgi:hypothetical protein
VTLLRRGRDHVRRSGSCESRRRTREENGHRRAPVATISGQPRPRPRKPTSAARSERDRRSGHSRQALRRSTPQALASPSCPGPHNRDREAPVRDGARCG